MQITPHVIIGKKQVKLTSPSHVAGVTEGNAPHNRREDRSQRGEKPGRSTGINAKGREPIDPSMPKLTPA